MTNFNATFALDRHGLFRWTFTGGPGSLNLTRKVSVGASLNADWLLQSKTPTASELDNFLMGHALAFGGGGGPYFIGGEIVHSPGTNTALGLGFSTPQIGASYGYTFDTNVTKVQTPFSW